MNRTATASLLLAAIASAAPLAGCASSGNSAGKTRVITLENDAVRVSEAQRLAASAETVDDPEEAIARYVQAVETYPDFPAAWNNLGVNLLAQGRYMEAAEAFGNASDRATNDPRPYYNLGLTWDLAGYLGHRFRSVRGSPGAGPPLPPGPPGGRSGRSVAWAGQRRARSSGSGRRCSWSGTSPGVATSISSGPRRRARWMKNPVCPLSRSRTRLAAHNPNRSVAGSFGVSRLGGLRDV